MNVSIDDLARLIVEELENYSEEADEIVKNTIIKVADEALKAVSSSPAIAHLVYDKHSYGNDFYIINEFKSRGKNKGFYKLRVASRQYQIAHLLEYGHATRNGGRTREFPHFINGQKVADTLPDRIKEALK